MNGNNKNKAMWIYTSILFIGVFVVLILTYISQLRFNNNIESYLNQTAKTSAQKDKIGIGSTLDENIKLKNEIKIIKNDLINIKTQKEKNDKELSDLKANNGNTQNVYESLIQAENIYKNGDNVSCAIKLIKEVNTALIGKEALDKYNYLVNKTFFKAAKTLYNQGYNDYSNENYIKAVENLTLSISLIKNEYFSDDCYFYIAYAQLKKGDNGEAKRNMEILIREYPNSNYISQANKLLKELP